MVMLQAGVEEFPGPLPAVKVVRYVAPIKSPPADKAPSVADDFTKFSLHLTYRYLLIISLPVAVLPA